MAKTTKRITGDYDIITGKYLRSNVESIFQNYGNAGTSTSYKDPTTTSTKSAPAYVKETPTSPKKGLHSDGMTTYYYGTCPHSGCDREFKVMAYFKNDPHTSISIPKHYDCFSCGESVTYVNPRVGLLTGSQYSSQQQKSQVSAPSSSSLFNRFTLCLLSFILI